MQESHGLARATSRRLQHGSRPLEIHHKEMLLPWYVQIENKRDEKP